MPSGLRRASAAAAGPGMENAFYVPIISGKKYWPRPYF